MLFFDLELSVRSPLGTPLAADTLFGHLCWGIRYTDGVAKLKEFLASFETPNPALLLSDPFPSGFWPMPLLTKPVPEDEDSLIDLIKRQPYREIDRRLPSCPLSRCTTSAAITDLEAIDIFKWLAKLRWIETDVLGRLVNNMSAVAILEHFIRSGCGNPNMPVEAMVAHNTINRLTNRPLAEDGFFFTKEGFVSPEKPAAFHVVLASTSYSDRDMVALFEHALAGGYGRDKSIGKGKIEVGRITSLEMPRVDAPNAVLLLGPCAPYADEPCEGYWQIFTRYGKLGGDWATGPGPTGSHNPFKRPLTMLKAGSVLLTDSPKPYYGRLIDNVHPEFDEVRHYGLALAMPIHCDLKEPR